MEPPCPTPLCTEQASGSRAHHRPAMGPASPPWHDEPAMIERVGFDDTTARELFLAQSDSVPDLDTQGWPAGHCIVLIAAATYALDEATIHRFVGKLLDAGAVY